MPPELTQEWAAVYLHVAIVLLTFGLGLPALMIDLTVDEELRQVIHRRLNIWRWLALTGIFVVVVELYIWFVHPGHEPINSAWKAWVAPISLTVLVLITCFSWWFLMVTYRRESIVKRLELSLRTALKNKDRRDLVLDDLMWVGLHTDHGHSDIVRVLAGAVNLAQVSPGYSGDSLEPIVHALEAVVVGRSVAEDSFVLAGRSLQQALALLHTTSRVGSSDAAVICRVGRRLATEAIDRRYERAALSFVQFAASASQLGVRRLPEQMLFSIGAVALNSDQHLIAVAALNALESVVVGNDRRAESVGCLVGLIAWFASSGPASRDRALSFVAAQPDLAQSFTSDVRKALDYHRAQADYLTADRLSELLAAR